MCLGTRLVTCTVQINFKFMSSSTFRSTLAMVTVFITCAMMLVVIWQKKSAAPKPYSFPCPVFLKSRTSEYGGGVSQPEPDTVHSCNLSNLTVLGKTVDRCATLQAVRLAEEEDIYVSIKTTSKNHVSRMLPVLLTWLQTLQPQQVILGHCKASILSLKLMHLMLLLSFWEFQSQKCIYM